MEDLLGALHFLRGYGVAPGTISGMAWSLFRQSLSGPVSLGFDPTIGRSALYGGRQEITQPRQFQHMVSADIRCAYPFSMAQKPYALTLRSVSTETHLDPEVAGIARATVIIPSDMRFNPLPIRLGPQMIQFQSGMIKGTWPWVELAAAQATGAEVKVTECWAPRTSADLFASWYPIVMEGRQLPGGAGMILKAVANSLWGQFGMVAVDKAQMRWADEGGEVSYVVEVPGRTMPHEWGAHIAAETTARVRSKTYLALDASPSRPVHCDTDGFIQRKSAPLPSPAGDQPGQWRVKETMRTVDVRAPQLYRYKCGTGCGVTHAQWHYVAAGMTKDQAEGFFRREGNSPTPVSFLASFDECLPPLHKDDDAGNHVRMVSAQAKERL
jgi:hypothetical protein